MKRFLQFLEAKLREPLYWLLGLATRRRPLSLEELKSYPPRSILLIRADGVGDMVLTLPFIRALHELYPEAPIDMVIYNHSRSLVENFPGVNELLIFEKKKWLSVLALLWRLRRKRRDWAIHIAFTTSLTFGFMAHLGGKISISVEKPRGSLFHNVLVPAPDEHTFRKQEALARAFGYSGPFELIPLELTDKDREFIQSLRLEKMKQEGRKLVGVFLGNALKIPTGCWRTENYAKLAYRLTKELHCQIFVLWGPGDRRLLQPFHMGTYGLFPAPITIPLVTLRQLAALIQELDLIVGTPTGPTHMAEAMGTPWAAFLRDSVYLGWRPLGKKSTIIRAHCQNVDAISVDKTFDVIKDVFKGSLSRS